jgi:predicted RNA binding protein YcfA (HicA-like mRNA interferase family)
MVGLLLNALPCPDVCLKGKTNKRLSPTSRKLSRHGSGPKIRRPSPATRIGSIPKFWSPYSPMARLANISGKEASKAFQKAGWQAIGQVGSHLVLSKPGLRVNLSIPQHKELSVGTLRALIRHAGMTVEEFLALV